MGADRKQEAQWLFSQEKAALHAAQKKSACIPKML
jgi:hypothetical protein